MDLATSVKTEDRTSMSISLEDNRILSYATYGPEDGTPFILFHGSPGSRISMDDELFHQLGIKMIYPERPGYGNSSANPKATFKSWAADMEAFLDHLELEKVAIGGGSGGGPYALACAAYNPDRFNSVSLIASAAPHDIPGYKDGMAMTNRLGYLLNKYAPFVVKYISQNFAKGLKKNPDKTFNQVFNQLCEADKAIIQLMKENGTYPVMVEHLQEAFVNGVEGHLADMRIFSKKWDIPYQKISCPVHIWHGEDDTLAPILGAKAFAEFLPNTETHFMANAGHLLTENPITLQQILEKVK